jgi:hypothetical protein
MRSAAIIAIIGAGTYDFEQAPFIVPSILIATASIDFMSGKPRSSAGARQQADLP